MNIYQQITPISDKDIISWGNFKVTKVPFDNNIRQHKICDKNVTIKAMK